MRAADLDGEAKGSQSMAMAVVGVTVGVCSAVAFIFSPRGRETILCMQRLVELA
jgi:hypothetical protein